MANNTRAKRSCCVYICFLLYMDRAYNVETAFLRLFVLYVGFCLRVLSICHDSEKYALKRAILRNTARRGRRIFVFWCNSAFVVCCKIYAKRLHAPRPRALIYTFGAFVCVAMPFTVSVCWFLCCSFVFFSFAFLSLFIFSSFAFSLSVFSLFHFSLLCLSFHSCLYLFL